MAEPILVLRIIKTIIGILGLFGNGLVCLVVYRVRAMHTMTNAFIFNQAVADFMGSLFMLLLSNITQPPRLPEGVAGFLLCHIWLSDFLQWACFIASTFNLVGVTFERYVAIVFPFRHQILFTRRNSCFLMASAWVVGTLFATYSIVIRVFKDGKCVEELQPATKEIGFVITVIQYTIPTFSMLFAYIHIIVELHRSARRVGQDPGSMGSVPQDGRNGSLLRARRNTFKTLLIVYCVYFCCWTPNLTVFAMFNLGWPLDFSGAVYIVSVALVASNSCVNPIIYALKYRQFQKGLRKLFSCSRGQLDSDLDSLSVRIQRSSDRLTVMDARAGHDQRVV